MRELFRIVIVLGAGVSYEAGAPLMFNFFDKARFIFSKGNLSANLYEDFKKVFEAIDILQTAHSKSFLDIYNLESVFTAFEFANLINVNPIFNQDLIKSLKKLIAVTIEKSLKFRGDKGLEAPISYSMLAELIKEWRKLSCSVTIITFNYDIALDYALLKAGIDINYSLDNIQYSHNPLTLLKPHGSLHWMQCKACNEIIPLDLKRLLNRSLYTYSNPAYVEFASYIQSNNKTHSQLNKSTCNGTLDDVSFIVPPTWNKYGYYQSISPIWRCAAKELLQAKSILVCGYSLPSTDQFFHNLYALGSMGGEPLHSFNVYNPDNTGETNNRFRKLLGAGSAQRYDYIGGESGKFIRSIQEINIFIENLLAD